MRRLVAMFAVAAALGAGAVPATAEDDAVIEEVLGILKERGLVDEGKYSELVSRNRSYEEEHQSLLGKIEWSGDLRARLENFWYEDTRLNEDRDNRTRARYRLRIQGKAEVNDYVDAVFRLASGERVGDDGDARSTNRTLGKDNDFGNDDIFIDLAYIELKAPSSYLPESSKLKLAMGKTKNPFRWKNGKDYMLWDSDITPEGAGVMFEMRPTEEMKFFANAGYYVVDENSTSRDPNVFGLQGGLILSASEDVEIGGRLSWYNWSSLNMPFYVRGAVNGNIVDGLSDDAPSRGDISAGELAAYVRYKGIENWPLLVYGHYARNFDAASSDLFPAANDEDTGWGLGVEVGDKKKYVKLGAGYYRVEANFWPAQFTDSDLFDGETNRKGWTFYGSRQILPNTDLNVTLFWSDSLRTSNGFETSLNRSERVRLQTDLVVKF